MSSIQVVVVERENVILNPNRSIFRELLTKNSDNVDACVVLLSQQSRHLDELQHSLMHLQYCMRLSALITVTDAKMEKEVNKWFHELKTSAKAWSTIKFVR